MDRATLKPDTPVQASTRSGGVERPGLHLVSTGLRLAEPLAAPDPAWNEALAQLLGWLDIAVEPVAAMRAPGLRPGLRRVADWALAAAGSHAAPVFAPWRAISPVSLQGAGAPDLPRADWTASYLFDHAQGYAQRNGPLDLVLMSAHPARCEAEAEGDAPLPRLAIMAEMIRAARAEGRSRVAIILPARQRNAAARQLLLLDRELTREGVDLEILGIEEALGSLMAPQPRWDALIVVPELRSIVFAMLARATGIAGPWPMLWHGPHGLVLVAAEALEGTRLPLDATVLVQALALTLRQAGKTAAALRLHQSAGRLRDSGVVTPARGSPAPYVTEIDEAQFVARVCTGPAPARRPVPHWRALPSASASGTTGEAVRLTLVGSSLSASLS